MRSQLFDFEPGVQNVLTDLVQHIHQQSTKLMQLTHKEQNDLSAGGKRSTEAVTRARLIAARSLREVLWVDIAHREFGLGYQKPEQGHFSRAGWPVIGALLRIDHSAIVHALKKYPDIQPIWLDFEGEFVPGTWDIPAQTHNTGASIHGL